MEKLPFGRRNHAGSLEGGRRQRQGHHGATGRSPALHDRGLYGKEPRTQGYVEGRLVGNTYLYRPSVSEAEYKKKFMGHVVRDYFDNSYKELVNFLLNRKKLSAGNLRKSSTDRKGK